MMFHENSESADRDDTVDVSTADVLRFAAEDPAFDEVISQLVNEALFEVDMPDWQPLRTHASGVLVTALVTAIPAFEDALIADYPNEPRADLFADAVQAAVQRAFDFDFRAGRGFHAHGHELHA